MATNTLLYAGLLGLIAIVIGAIAGRTRGKAGVSIGHGGNDELLLAMRRHANFVEWVPLTLILIALLEIQGVNSTAIHGFGGSLVIFRICHAVGLQADTMAGMARAIGAGGNALLLLILSVWAIASFF
ncbi:MAG: MAPEG family protein [Pseudomonadaceae bacterium]|nr:MAPEG family protein [Pseudomonadaceae bacterium]